MKCGRLLLLALGLFSPSLALGDWAPNLVAVEVGRAVGIKETTLIRGELFWSWSKPLLEGRSSSVVGYWELSVGYWDGDRRIVDVGLTPVFRWERRTPTLVGEPYLEAAIGAHVISHVRMYDRGFSTGFQFGDHVGLGTRFGEKNRFDLSYKLQHLSNGSIKEPNSGMLFNIVRLAVGF